MEMINVLFLKIVEMSLTAGIVIGVVMLVRLLLKGLPKHFSYILWIAVAFRLVVPLSADSDISIFNLFVMEDISSKLSGGGTIETTKNAGCFRIADGDLTDSIDGQAKREEYVQGSTASASADSESISNIESADALYLESFLSGSTTFGVSKLYSSLDIGSFIGVMAIVWIAGIMIIVSYTVSAYIRIYRRVRYSIRLYGNIYESDTIRSPFVLGIIRPKIYLPFRLSEAEQQCVLAHERYHIARRDYLIKSFAYVLAVVYWFQPLVWIAYHLMCIDMEMSCDEKIISEFTADMRKEYSRLLLAFAVNKRQITVRPLAFGKENTKKRVRNILNYKKASRWKLTVGTAVMVFTLAACATDASIEEAAVPGLGRTAAADDDMTVNTANDTIVTVHHSERNDELGHHQEEQFYHTIEHHQAQWAENSMCDLELCSLDYADSDKIIFHISSGLFQYDLQEQKITRSVDLKALNCQAVQTGGECEIAVYQGSGIQLRAVIRPYPYSDGDAYVYDLESDELFAYDISLLDGYTLFDSLVSRYDLPEDDWRRDWRFAEYVLPLEDHSYGVLRWETINLADMYYEAGNQKWVLFHKEQATMPKLLKQDDSFYESVALNSGKNISQCMLDYMGLYNRHDYAGVCALSTGVEYSDEMQRHFSERSDLLSLAEEVSHSEDEKEYLFQFSSGDDYGVDGPKIYVNFKYIEGEGWRAEGLPRAQQDIQ